MNIPAEYFSYLVILAVILFIAAQSRFLATLVVVVATGGFAVLLITVLGWQAALVGLAGFGFVAVVVFSAPRAATAGLDALDALDEKSNTFPASNVPSQDPDAVIVSRPVQIVTGANKKSVFGREYFKAGGDLEGAINFVNAGHPVKRTKGLIR